MNLNLSRIWLHKNRKQKETWKKFLLSCGIRDENNIDYCCGIYDGEVLAATGSLYKNVIKCVAVKEEYQGGAAIAMLISHLLNQIYHEGYLSSFVYTKPDTAKSFLHLGFKEIAVIPNQLSFLEKSSKGVEYFIENLKKQYVSAEKIAGIVMNANPFTKGHLHLVKKAASENGAVHLFVLSEELSVFPKNIRMKLVKEAVKDLKNVYIHETEDYMVSAATFPSYFLKENADVTKIQGKLDAVIFKNHIAEALGITTRYVGEEPLSFATNIYNEALKEVFQDTVELTVVPRKTYKNQVISASQVRKLMEESKFDEIKEIVPENVYHFMVSAEGMAIAEKIKTQDSGCSN